jgi:hypothetical protein
MFECKQSKLQQTDILLKWLIARLAAAQANIENKR